MTDGGALGLGVLIVFAALLLVLARRDWLAPTYPERRRVLVNTKDDQAVSGTLWEKNREYLVLKGAQLVQGREKPIPMDGDVVIYRDRVLWVQVLHGVG